MSYKQGGISPPVTETQGGTNQTTYTTGDILYASNTNTLSKLSLPSNPGQYLEYNGTNVAYFNWLQEMRIVEDFLVPNSGTALPYWRFFTANGGDQTFPDVPDSGHPGVMSLSTGTATNGESLMIMGQQSTTVGNIILGGGAIDIYWVIKLPNLSDGTDTYELSIGLGDSQNFTDTSYDNGVFFNYSSTINSGQWQLSTSASSVKTTSNTSTAVGTGWTTLRINVNAAASLCTYYVNGVSVGTINSHIPTTTISPAANIAKSAGTTARKMYVDLVYLYQKLTAAR